MEESITSLFITTIYPGASAKTIVVIRETRGADIRCAHMPICQCANVQMSPLLVFYNKYSKTLRGKQTGTFSLFLFCLLRTKRPVSGGVLAELLRRRGGSKGGVAGKSPEIRQRAATKPPESCREIGSRFTVYSFFVPGVLRQQEAGVNRWGGVICLKWGLLLPARRGARNDGLKMAVSV
jgi:hypothetical protein